MVVANISFAQYRNLNQLPDSVRNKALVEIANKAIAKYSIGYLREGNKPYIEDCGILTKDNRKGVDRFIGEDYIGRYIYSVYYLPTEEAKVFDFSKQNYIVKAFILADIGEVTLIRYFQDFFVHGKLETYKDEVKHKRKFRTVEEYYKEKEIERLTHESFARLNNALMQPTNDMWSKLHLIESNLYRIGLSLCSKRDSVDMESNEKIILDSLERNKSYLNIVDKQLRIDDSLRFI